MEQTKDNLLHDYNKAVESFVEADYSSFFRNIRPAIEYMCQYFIFDIWGNESQALDLINGEVSIVKDRTESTYHFSENSANFRPTGRALPDLFTKVYYCKHPDVFSARADETKKRLKRGIDSCSAELCRYYCIASEIGSHAGRTNMTVEIQAQSCAAFMMGFLDFLKSYSVLSSSAVSFVNTLKVFDFGNSSEIEKFQDKLARLIKESEVKELALLSAQKLQNEAEQRLLDISQVNAELEKVKQQLEEKNRCLEEEMRILKEDIMASKEAETITDEETQEPEGSLVVPNSMSEPTSGLIRSALVHDLNWDVSEESMDDDQLDLIEYSNDKSMLVAGCAGSGKSVIAMHKAEQLHNEGADVILIAYTKSLNRFMQNGNSKSAPFKFFYHYQWKKCNMPKADYIIVDEIQDFTREEIQEFIQSARKHFLFFGDSAQSIYCQYGKDTMSIEDIEEMTGLHALQLYNNYRLPRPVAQITQTYVGVNVPEYKEKVYQNKENELPHFIHFESEGDEHQAILKYVNENAHRSIGILLPSNPDVLKVCQLFKENNVPFEFKYNSDTDDSLSINNLDFRTLLPKIMTYHSAKGLQFDMVILPYYNGARDDESRKTLYVAMTRTMHSLYVLYSFPSIPEPLNVPSYLYLKE